jgi:4-amino-4-deoxy-L-arabinose transferase-like glycosyltransferase
LPPPAIAAILASMRAPRPYVPESVDPTEVSPAGRFRAVKQAGLVLLAVAWVALGLVGHDPWKVEDATTFGLAWDAAQRNDFLVPHLAGEPSLATPPLLTDLGALAIRAFAPGLEPFDAARLVAGVALAALLTFTALASRELAGRALRWPPVLVLIGTVGLWDRAHVVSPELAAAAAVAFALYALALALRRPWLGGVLTGLALGLAFLCAGPFVPGCLLVSMAVLPLLRGPWRTRAYAATAGLAVAIGAVLAAAWPLALHMRDPALLHAWVAAEAAAHYLPWSAPGELAPLYYPRNLLWFAFPALPLIAWMLWTRGRGFNGGLAEPAVQLPGVVALVMLAALVLRPDPHILYALPLLPPLALLAVLEIDSLTRGFSAALDWFGILTFGLLALVVWLMWIDARLYGMPANVATLFRDVEIGWQPSFHLGAVAAAVFMTVLWVMLVRPARRSNRRTLLNWAAGVTLVWCLYSTLWLPYLDSRRSYRHVIESSAVHFPDRGCVASRNVGDSQRVLWQYFTGLTLVREDTPQGAQCNDLLVQYGRQEGAPPALPGWFVTWDGRRRGDITERYVLYRRETP